MAEAIFTPEQLAEVKAYHWPHYLWAAVGDPFQIALYCVFLLFLIRPLYRWSEATAGWLTARYGAAARRTPVLRAVLKAMDAAWKGPGWGAALIFTLYFFWAFAIVHLPLSIYFSYVLESRHGLNAYSPAGFALATAKRLMLNALATAALAFGLYGLARRTRWWWLALGVVAGGALMVSEVVDPYRGRLYFEYHPLEAGALREQLTAMLGKAGIPFGDIVVEKSSTASKKATAYVAGRGPTRVVVLNDVLVAQFTPREILSAVAHEAGHVQESKAAGRAAAALALLAFLFLVHRLMQAADRRKWLGAQGYADIRTLPMMSMLSYVLLSASVPVACACSRAREQTADQFGLSLTHDPEAFETLLIRAARLNKMDPEPPHWVVMLEFDHPPINERIAWAESEKNTAGR